MQHPDFFTESEYLRFIFAFLETYGERAERRKKTYDQKVSESLKHYNSNNPDQFNDLTFNIENLKFLERKLKDIEKARSIPYFARIDFTPGDTKEEEKLYIGKMMLTRDDSTHEILIVDWRAPIASLYYEGRLGESKYVCEEGEITGELTLKRQFEIRDKNLAAITDMDITTDDSFLKAALSRGADNRLKDIVTTIQAEQNQIIRAGLYKNLVVQGAAGGGKTTIALHRIAYLLYAYQNKINPAQIMIIAPSKFFISYISEVLPDLGVEFIQQTTFEDFVTSFIKIPFEVFKPSEILSNLIESGNFGDNFTVCSNLKSSLKFRDIVCDYAQAVISRLIPISDFSIEGFVILRATVIKELFVKDYAFLNVARRIAKLKAMLEFQLKNKKPEIIAHVEKIYDTRREQIKRKMKEDSPQRREKIIALLNERDAKLEEIKKQCKKAVKEYMKQINPLTPLQYYLKLFSKPVLLQTLSNGIFTESEVESITSTTVGILKSGKISTDDLAPVLYLQHVFEGIGGIENVLQVVIDEAQDFGYYQLWVLQYIMKNSYFSIFGDLAQGIYSFKGVTAWKDVSQIYEGFGKDIIEYEIVQSYRTTKEIMDAANAVIKFLPAGIPPARSVLRYGAAVNIYEMPSQREIAAAIDERIEGLYHKNYKSFAIICKTLSECEKFKKLLKNEVKVITGKESDFSGNVLLVPIYLAKGLEFDYVCVADASAENYSENALDVKLLYIAMTRAMHELVIFSLGEKTLLLKNL
ncbi:MAG: ATP-binding domain-containing protein [Clostridiales bacterium]|nr:ATP-binding domain-containing protein [Clostridiales bacterium]